MKTLRTKFSWQPFLMVMAVVGMLFWASSCSDESTSPTKGGNMLRLPVTVLLHGNTFELTTDPTEWMMASLEALETMAPAGSDEIDDASSESQVGQFTSTKLIAYYVTEDGETGSLMENLLIDNVSRAISHNGTMVSQLGQIFAEGDIPPNLAEIKFYVCTELPVSMAIGPVTGGSSMRTSLTFAAITPDALAAEVLLPAVIYKTDKDRVIRTTDDGWPTLPDLTPAQEDDWLRSKGLLAKVEKKGPATDSYNCHGWTFTCGKKWLGSPDDVKKILDDNGYKPVTDAPKPGDVVVYEKDGKITHTGIVRSNDGRGNIKIESKWGRLGRYIHAPNDVPSTYGTPRYVRTTRTAPEGSGDPDKDKHTLKS